MDKMIEDFSKWVITQGFDCKMPLHTVHGIQNADKSPVFSSAIVQACWQAWQASRQALVVELPVEIDATHEDCQHSEYAYLADSVKSALDNAGIKWTE